MVRNILVSRDLWGHVIGDDVRPGNAAPATPGRAPIAPPSPIAKQKRWDSKYALTLLAVSLLTFKRSIIPHIKSCRHAKDAWDILETLYSAKK